MSSAAVFSSCSLHFSRSMSTNQQSQLSSYFTAKQKSRKRPPSAASLAVSSSLLSLSSPLSIARQLKARTNEEYLWDLWASLLEVGRERVDCREIIRSVLEEMTREGGEDGDLETMYWYKGGWGDLPVLSMQMGEDFNNGDLSSPDGPSHLQQSFLSLNSFYAYLAQYKILRPLAPFPFYALVSFHNALEIDETPPNVVWLEGCYIWVENVGTWLVGLEMEAEGKIWTWRGRKGFCKERWEFWKLRLRKLERGRDAEIRKIAKRTREKMEGAES